MSKLKSSLWKNANFWNCAYSVIYCLGIYFAFGISLACVFLGDLLKLLHSRHVTRDWWFKIFWGLVGSKNFRCLEISVVMVVTVATSAGSRCFRFNQNNYGEWDVVCGCLQVCVIVKFHLVLCEVSVVIEQPNSLCCGKCYTSLYCAYSLQVCGKSSNYVYIANVSSSTSTSQEAYHVTSVKYFVLTRARNEWSLQL